MPMRRTFSRCCARAASGHAVAAPPSSVMKLRRFMCGWPRLARDHLACSAEVACSHVSGLLVQSGWTAGPDGVREPSPHHSNRIDVPMKRQASLGCVGIDRLCHHASLLSRKLQRRPRRTKPPQPWAGILSRAASPPRRCVPSCSPARRLRPAAVAADGARSPTDRLWSPSIAADWRLPH